MKRIWRERRNEKWEAQGREGGVDIAFFGQHKEEILFFVLFCGYFCTEHRDFCGGRKQLCEVNERYIYIQFNQAHDSDKNF